MEHHETQSPDRNRCWTEIDHSQLIRNLRVYQAQLPEGAEIMAVIKANAYGHGDRTVAKTLYDAGIRRFAVATLAEAIRLRAAVPDAELLILGYTPAEDAPLLSQYRLTQAIVSRAMAGLGTEERFALIEAMEKFSNLMKDEIQDE